EAALPAAGRRRWGAQRSKARFTILVAPEKSSSPIRAAFFIPFLLGAEAPTRSLQGESDSAPWVSLTGPSSILARRSCTPSSATTTTSTVAAPPGQSSNLALVL